MKFVIAMAVVIATGAVVALIGTASMENYKNAIL